MRPEEEAILATIPRDRPHYDPAAEGAEEDIPPVPSAPPRHRRRPDLYSQWVDALYGAPLPGEDRHAQRARLARQRREEAPMIRDATRPLSRKEWALLTALAERHGLSVAWPTKEDA